MNKSELIKAMAEGADLTQADAGKALDTTIDVITKTITGGDQVAIAGFGTFVRKDRPARMGRNPRTGEPVQISAKRSAAFKPSAALKSL